MTMYVVRINTETPQMAMLYAVSTPQANALFREHFIEVRKATDLEIAEHVRAGKPIIGEPAKPDPNQTQLPNV